MPTIVPVTAAAAEIANPAFALTNPLMTEMAAREAGYHLLQSNPAIRLFLAGALCNPAAILLPLDRVFDIRCAAALQLWRLLSGKVPDKGPKPLTAQHRARLVLALRALDARLQRASYREIAKGLFNIDAMTARNWETHDVRDRTIRLVRLGTSLMDGGYRQLLLYPFRVRL